MIKKGNRANGFLKNIHLIFFNLKHYKFMKKTKPFGELFYHSLKKILLTMRIAVVFMILSILQAHAKDAYSQNTRLSLNYSETELVKVLDKIEDESEFFFLYNEKLLDTERKVSIVAEDQLINEILENLFANTHVNYTIVDRKIILAPDYLDEVPELQQNVVSGTVINEKGDPLSGVTVQLKSSTIGTVTDSNGKFSVAEIPSDGILIISFIGMITQEIPLNGRIVIDVVLIEQTIGLEEVTVIGYGVQSSRYITGSISKVDMAKTQNLPNTNIAQALRGQVAGVQFTENGRPGQNGTILIRGPRSLTAGNIPLIVLDGIIYDGNLSDINPNDIESMGVLKDASSAAIYGSRAANGVILVTSKKGSTEKPTININGFSGISDWSYKVKLLSPERYQQKTVDVLNQNGTPADLANIRNYLTTSELVKYDAGITTDPYDEISQQGKINSLNLNLSGNTKSTNYFLSGSFTDERGLIYNDNLKRFTLRANIENKVNRWLTVGLNTTYIKKDGSGQVANLSSAYYATPYGTWYYDDGLPTEYVIKEDQIPSNAMRMSLLTDNENIYDGILANFYSIIDLAFIEGLTYRINFSPNNRWVHNFNSVRQDVKIPTVNNTSASKSNSGYSDWVLENIINYSKKINLNHAIDVTLLYGKNHSEFESTSANSNKLSSDLLSWNNLGLGETMTNTSIASASSGVSSMFRLNYHIMEKYFFTFTIRRDGSSVFAENNKYGTFPSVAFAWIASDERFLKNISFLDQLKFRFSYGAVGNQAISPYQSLSLSATTRYVFGDLSTSSLGVYPSNMANSDLKWETTYTADAAIDFALFSNRIGGTFEIYNMDTRNLLVRRSLPSMTGYTYVLSNLGATSNKGFEVTLNTLNIQTSQFEWTSGITFSRNINKIVHLYNSDSNGDGKEDDDISNLWFIGQPVNVAYDYVFDGIYQEGDILPAGYKPGYIRLKDLNEDGVLNASDREIIGQTKEPKYRWGISNTFHYRDFSLLIFINAMQGWLSPIINADYSVSGENFPHRPLNQIDAGWWTSENKSNTRPSLVYPNPYGIKYYYSRDFIRIQDVSLTYELPKKFITKAKLSGLRFTLSSKNLLNFTKWIGPDPETGYNDKATFYPTARSMNIGINFGF
jgi:TonB-linked SusC/RagA family outer membrane protein